MSTFFTFDTFVPVPNAFVEVAPATLIGEFAHHFNDPLIGDTVYIRPGNANQQDMLTADGSEWLVYTRSVLSFNIFSSNDGVALIVSLSLQSGPAGAPPHYDWRVFHIPGTGTCFTCVTGVEVPGLLVRFRLVENVPGGTTNCHGNIILRGM